VATTSRGALVALGASSVGVLVSSRARRRGRAAPAVLLAAAAAVLMGFGVDRLQARFAQAPEELSVRAEVWRDALERTAGVRIAGTGFNTFAAALSRARPWPLPEGATSWPPIGSSVRVPAGLKTMGWYREAHNDYVQVLVETGAIGLALGLWMAGAVLRRSADHPWLTVALAAVLLHVAVDFDLQIPAIAVLFVVLAGLPARR
jgi:O-antigen ligase